MPGSVERSVLARMLQNTGILPVTSGTLLTNAMLFHGKTRPCPDIKLFLPITLIRESGKHSRYVRD
jgi:hypothetical protein